MLSVDQKITKARADLVMGHPFFGTLALRLKMVQDPSIETSVTNGATIRYNPEYVKEMPNGKIKGMLAHSVMHSAFLHHTRRGARDVSKWNKACDYAINPILEQAKFELPEGKFNDPQYAGMTAEHIYSLLPEEPGDQNPGQNPDPGGDGGVEDSPNSQNQGSSQSQEHAEEAEWKIAVSQAAHVAKQQGKLPGDIERMLEELLEPVFPWKDILWRFATEKSNDDFSWKRGNRRFIGQGIYLPSRVSDDSMGIMVVVIDTSGSISQRELTEFGSEIAGIHRDVRPRILYVIYCDADIAHIDEFGSDDEVTFAAHGGGSTDFRPPFTWIEEQGIEPRALVYLTDGYGPFPEESMFPVMWCINNHDVVPPHGEHLVLEI